MFPPQQNDAMHMTILSRHGQRYSCSLPPPPLPPPLSEEEEEEAGKEGRLSSEKLPNVSHLLQPLSERACLIKVPQETLEHPYKGVAV